MSVAGNEAVQLPPGLGFAREFVTLAEEAELIAAIEASGIAPVAFDPGNPRGERTYGWYYHWAEDPARHYITPTDPLPDAFKAIRARAARFAGLEPESLIQCLLLRYDPGSVIQPHCDMPAWNNVIGLSLGEALTMEFVNADKVMPVELAPRSIYHQTGAARYVWQHSIPAVTRTRWGITFRDFSDEGRAMAGLGGA